MERDWIVGIFALAGVLVGAVLSYMLRRAERKDERGYVERKRTIDRLEELHFEIAELMSKCTNFGISGSGRNSNRSFGEQLNKLQRELRVDK
jgi:hypothetical protein